MVSPFLLDEEKAGLRRLLLTCKRSAAAAPPVADHVGIASALQDSKRSIDSILDLLNNFFFLDTASPGSIEELIELVAETVGRSDLQQAAIARSLFAREEYGSTLTEDGRCMLLHCRTTGVAQPYLGVIKLNGRVKSSQGSPPAVALIMLAPQDCARQVLDVMSAVGASTVEYHWMVDTLCTGDRSRCHGALEQVLADYYGSRSK